MFCHILAWKCTFVDQCHVRHVTYRWEQAKELSAGCEIVVATPGRLIDLLKDKVKEVDMN